MKLTSISPLLESNDLQGTIKFYAELLGFTMRGSFKEGEELVWCDLVKDNVSIMFTKPNGHMNDGKIMLSGSIYITVEDVDALWNLIKDKCDVVYPIEDFVYGMREFAIRDNNGYVLNFGSDIGQVEGS
ncbi:MAG TPA: VOC family protein [Ferruginibacter sp.]|nr:VOC family protein [Ferruginibacter sp.]